MTPAAAPLLAAVFDMDGTLVDNMDFHNRAWVSLARKLGLEGLTAERFQSEFAGKKNEEILPQLLGRNLSVAELDALAEEKESHYRAIYRPYLTLHRGAEGFLQRLRDARLPMAVATAAPQGNRELVLDGLSVRPFFASIVGAEQVTRGKPAPDIFLAAARALNVPPESCLAFEDAINGVLSARAAGMITVGITTTTTAEALKKAGAHYTAPDFDTLPPELLARLFSSRV
ncbi:beta-phosphoglucomutase family hydrolase [Corallococcus caeni]|uniref:HAD family phosphatase n=2 Tax=Corallococcus TaxID=83461 RepID=A0A7Y4JUQ0_9BACT|nr:HAD family phosphatase [Corallococcus exercitus]NOK11525.1 HAD family phosphatase [Corallococcus exercitus]GMT96210.1 beta-phosphoglucomutase family hydrolase [Corallococcus sp. KH5-1]